MMGLQKFRKSKVENVKGVDNVLVVRPKTVVNARTAWISQSLGAKARERNAANRECVLI